jgi:hypothetical protein
MARSLAQRPATLRSTRLRARSTHGRAFAPTRKEFFKAEALPFVETSLQCASAQALHAAVQEVLTTGADQRVGVLQQW